MAITIVPTLTQQIWMAVRGGLAPLWKFLFGTTIGAILLGVSVGTLIPWQAGSAVVKLFAAVFAFVVGTYVVLVLSTVFPAPAKR